MQLLTNRNRQDRVEGAYCSWLSRKLMRRAGIVGVMLLITLATAFKLSSQQYPQQLQAGPNPNKSLILPEANRPPDANSQTAMREQQAKKMNIAAANSERKRQLGDDSARLLKLASDLKAEVDKTSKDELSLGVIRKADEIERLAHEVKEKMKLTMNAN